MALLRPLAMAVGEGLGQSLRASMSVKSAIKN